MGNQVVKKEHPRLPVLCGQDGLLYSRITGQHRKAPVNKKGYCQVSIRRSSFLVHRLIAEAFIPNPDNKPKINHKNGIKSDNRPENLEWCTQRENIIHARDKLGVKYTLPGEQNPNAKFFASHAIILGNLHRRGFTMKDISEIMGFSPPTIAHHLKGVLCENRGEGNSHGPDVGTSSKP